MCATFQGTYDLSVGGWPALPIDRLVSDETATFAYGDTMLHRHRKVLPSREPGTGTTKPVWSNIRTKDHAMNHCASCNKHFSNININSTSQLNISIIVSLTASP
jgi:hypothetical protein